MTVDMSEPSTTEARALLPPSLVARGCIGVEISPFLLRDLAWESYVGYCASVQPKGIRANHRKRFSSVSASIHAWWYH